MAGLATFIGLPVARLREMSVQIRGLLHGLAAGIVVFMLWDVLGKTREPIEKSLDGLHRGDAGSFMALVAIFVAGAAIGLLVPAYLAGRTRASEQPLAGAGAAVAGPTHGLIAIRWLVVVLAIGFGFHSLVDGQNAGQAAAGGAISSAAVLLIGFALHNLVQGLAIGAPIAAAGARPPWGFLLGAGLITGGPSFLGAVIGYNFKATRLLVLFSTLGAGVLVYAAYEIFGAGRRIKAPAALGWGVVLGFVASYATDVTIGFAGA
jgi:ZIP family zinc transporter